ncbi:MPN domain-containing protein [Trichonephila clavipes]|nr:MPN domain-containing protein [Trichonephila clavipes]
MTNSAVRIATIVGYNCCHIPRHRIKEALDVFLGYSSPCGINILPNFIWCSSRWCILDQLLNLAVLQAFPCRSGLGDKDSAARVEDEIRRSLERRHLSVVGWYHSHPTFPAQPTIKDVDSQMEYQITMKGDSDSSYTPCLGLICSPYDNQRPATEADYLAYWVMPPPERLISEYYRSTGEALDFNNSFANQGTSTYWEKLQSSLRTKLPRDLMVTGAQSTAQAQAVTHFWDFLKGLIMT